MLIELLTFFPWSDGSKWNAKIRDAALADAATEMPGLGPDDFSTLTNEFDVLMKAVRRQSIRWGRVAAMTVLGLGVGAFTGGLAAPAVGAAVGGTLGLSGAAATSAGLAALGGGSIAAGGFGVAGAGMRYSRLGSGSIALDAIKLDLVARLLITESEDRDQKIRRVAESLNQVANDLSKKVNLLSARIAQLKENNRILAEENNTLRAKVTQLSAELRQLRDAELRRLRSELGSAELDQTTVEVVLDRLKSSVRQ